LRRTPFIASLSQDDIAATFLRQRAPPLHTKHDATSHRNPSKQRAVCRDTLARLHHEGHDHEQIAAIMGFSASTIKQRLGQMFPKVQEVVEIRRQDILPLWQSGATMPELAERFGCSETTLRNKLRALHLPRRAWIARQWQIIEDKPDPDKPVEEPATMTGRCWRQMAAIQSLPRSRKARPDIPAGSTAIPSSPNGPIDRRDKSEPHPNPPRARRL
jgi:lambda repressor-like predicted transcriptional regulator